MVGCAVARMEERINLRLSSEVYRPYSRLAQLMTGLGHPITATGLVRILVESQVEQMEILIAYAEAALRGDKESAHEVYDQMLAWNQSTIDVARAVEESERRALESAVKP